MASEHPHVVILGGGFGGLNAAKSLSRAPVRVTLVDRSNHHLFQPLLYQVATAALSAIDIGAPIRQILRRQQNLTVLMDTADKIDSDRKTVLLTHVGELSFDYLIVATGATHSYFGNSRWATLAPGLKTIEDALLIRKRVLSAFENAELESDPGVRQSWLTFVIVGAGPTGAELAGALSEIARHTLVEDFRNFDPSDAKIILVEAGPRVLSTYPEDLSEKARRQLEKLGVEVRLGTSVTDIDRFGVVIGADRIDARTVLWAAGVAASELGASLGVPVDRSGRVRVESDLTIPGNPNVAVVGDLAHIEQDGHVVPGVAPAAVQQGRLAAKNIRLQLQGRPRQPFRYKDYGSMATLGRKSGVAALGRAHLSGLPAWMAWLFVHILFLIGFRNRIVVMFEWSKS
ncbi:MAG: NAD(P)/FAD-dependent oxidoreductase [Acidobacteriota bacterium]